MIRFISRHILRSNNTLALDIGSKYMKLMGVERTGRMPTLHAGELISAPSGSIENGIVRDAAAVAAALSRALDKHKLHGSSVYLATGGSNLILRWIEMPALPEEHQLDAVKFEARKYLPIPMEQAVLDYKVLTSKNRQESETQRILLIAAPRAMVNSRFETAELAGLRPIGMDIEPLAVMRALECSTSRTELAWGGHPQTILVFGSAGTDFYVTKDSDLEFARRIPIGGSHLAELIAQHLSLDMLHTEERRVVDRMYFDEQGIRVEGGTPELIQALEDEITRLEQEIQRSCSYYRSLFPEGSYEGVLTHIVAGGGLVSIKGFVRHLSRRLEMPVEIADPLSRISVRNLHQDSDLMNGSGASFIVSAGLLLGLAA